MFGRFVYHFLHVIWHLRSVNMALLALIVIGAVIIAGVETIPFGDAGYFSVITGLTVGFGAIVAHTAVGRWVAVLLGFVGIIFTGLIVAAAVYSVQETLQELHDRDSDG